MVGGFPAAEPLEFGDWDLMSKARRSGYHVSLFPESLFVCESVARNMVDRLEEDLAKSLRWSDPAGDQDPAPVSPAYAEKRDPGQLLLTAAELLVAQGNDEAACHVYAAALREASIARDDKLATKALRQVAELLLKLGRTDLARDTIHAGLVAARKSHQVAVVSDLQAQLDRLGSQRRGPSKDSRTVPDQACVMLRTFVSLYRSIPML
jgi:hypothetical protein